MHWLAGVYRGLHHIFSQKISAVFWFFNTWYSLKSQSDITFVSFPDRFPFDFLRVCIQLKGEGSENETRITYIFGWLSQRNVVKESEAVGNTSASSSVY